MHQKPGIAACLCEVPGADGADLKERTSGADWLTVRADRCGDLDPDWLAAHFEGGLIYALPRPETAGERQTWLERIRWAVRCYDLVELSAHGDLVPDVLDAVPAGKRMISWHGPLDQRSKIEEVMRTEARFYRFTGDAGCAADAIAPLDLLVALGRDDVIAYAHGAAGFWSRILSVYAGSPLIFAEFDDEVSAHGAPSLSRLVRDFDLVRADRPRDLHGIIGCPVLHSGSPRVHNEGYRTLGRKALYLPIHAASFDECWREIAGSRVLEQMGMRFKGFTVVSPHKEAAASHFPSRCAIVGKASSCNALTLGANGWEAATTDADSVLQCLGDAGIVVAGKKVCVIGCGGAGRSMAAALQGAGGRVTMVNRGKRRGRLAQHLLGLPFVPLAAFSAEDAEIVVHATPLGRDPDDPPPFDMATLSPDSVIVDLVYGSRTTPLVAEADRLGCDVIDGKAVLAVQAARQFELMTGEKLPTEAGMNTGIRSGMCDGEPAGLAGAAVIG
ncbi:MAG: type I 3-dehydroquinate dehydratase [Pseudomonadota bacterium]